MDDPARRTSDECTFGDRPDRRDLTIDPLNPCMSLGAMYAAFGIHRAMPLSHGASGCARFQRMEIARHFQRVLHVPSTMLDDRAAMYGGEDDVREAVANVFRLYDPETIVLFTTCLSETIGDDMQGIVDRLGVPEGKRAVWVSTPSYTGSHLAGYGACVAAMIGQLARPLRQEAPLSRLDAHPARSDAWLSQSEVHSPCSETWSDRGDANSGGVNTCGLRGDRALLVPGWCDPADVEAIEELVAPFFADTIVLPDIRDVYDVRPSDAADVYPSGGTPLRRIEEVASCGFGLFVGIEATEAAARAFEEASPRARIVRSALPIGVTASDAIVKAAHEMSGRVVPGRIAEQRRRAVEALMSQADLLYGKRAMVICDADAACGMAGFLVDAGMVPACVVAGDTASDFEERLQGCIASASEERSAANALPCAVLASSDRLDAEEWLAAHPVDIILGDSRNKRLAARAGVPLARVGFPNTDRPLSFIDSYMGYRGTIRLLRDIADALIEAEEASLEPHELPIARYF